MAYVDGGQGDAIVFQHGSLPAVGSDCVDWVTKAWVLGRLVAGHTRSVPFAEQRCHFLVAMDDRSYRSAGFRTQGAGRACAVSARLKGSGP